MLNKNDLNELIDNTVKRTGIQNVVVEKDYYVCLLLKELAKRQDELKAYFKGGTAVYKILSDSVRFSEDIDLTVKVCDDESNTQNRKRLKKSALDYKVDGLTLNEDMTIDKKGTITSFYFYDSSYINTRNYKANYVQVEATSFTVSEPVKRYTIEPYIYKYATDEEKKTLKEKFDISEFDIDIIALERIFIDKIFAAEFYYLRNEYKELTKHLYDIATLVNVDEIKEFLKDEEYVKTVIGYKRKEELVRLGGIDKDLKITDFSYLKFDYSDEIKKEYDEMLEFYVWNKNSKISLTDAIDRLKVIKDFMNKIGE